MPTIEEDTRELEIGRSTSTAHRLSRYNGICGNIHGHNMHWEVKVEVDMAHSQDDNMPLDLKDISDLIDEVDHACILSKKDIGDLAKVFGMEAVPAKREERKELLEEFFGNVYWFEGDPTCEVLVQWMADRIADLDPVVWTKVELYETDKYGIATVST